MGMAPSPGFWQEASPSPTGPAQRLLEPLQTWQVTSPRVRDPRENADSQCCLSLTLESHIPALPPYSTCRKQITQSQKGTWVLPFERDKYQRIRERILKPWRQRWLFSACGVEGRFLYVPASFSLVPLARANPITKLPDGTPVCQPSSLTARACAAFGSLLQKLDQTSVWVVNHSLACPESPF